MSNLEPSRGMDGASQTRRPDSTFGAKAAETGNQSVYAHLTAGAVVTRVEYPPGTIFGTYLLQEKLGEGGMGTVYKALHLRLKKVMALKILPMDKLRGQASISRFAREMEAAGRVNHPNIVPAFDAGEVNGVHFISMEYIKGGDLTRLVRESGPFSVAQACAAVRSAAFGLAAAHKAGVVHRDIKPSNILADGHGNYHILDLGLVLLGDDHSDRTELTAAGTWFGTPDYMAPEQWDDSHTVDSRTDLYALGCTLYYLLVGNAPYETSKHKSMVGKMHGHVAAPIPDLRLAREDVPHELAAIYTRLVAKLPEDRIQTAQELAAALEQFTRPPEASGPPVRPVPSPPVAVSPLVRIVPSHSTSQKRSDSVFSGPRWQGWPGFAPAPAIAPFDGPAAISAKQKWAAYLKLPVQHTNSLGMRFQLIPPGEFLMGSTSAEIAVALKEIDDDQNWPDFIKSEGPQHKVILNQPFYLGAHPVTQGDYEAVMQVNPSHFSQSGRGKAVVGRRDTSRHPVEMVSWNDATEFCTKLRQLEVVKRSLKRDGETAGPLDATEYRLPTEAEWEFACRAGTTEEFWFGENCDDLLHCAWYVANSEGQTHPVGELLANPFGLYDLHGNVWEWVNDWHDPAYFQQFAESPAVNPEGPSDSVSRRVLRGGSWSSNTLRCRSTFRGCGSPARQGSRLGLRLAFAPPEILGTQW